STRGVPSCSSMRTGRYSSVGWWTSTPGGGISSGCSGCTRPRSSSPPNQTLQPTRPARILFVTHSCLVRAGPLSGVVRPQRRRRGLKRGDRTPEEQARERARRDRELAQALEERPQPDQERYRAERWMALPLVLFSFALGPGLLWAGKDGVRWPKQRTAEPGAA